MGSPDSGVHKEPPDICELSPGVCVVMSCQLDWTKKWLGELGRLLTSLKAYVQSPALVRQRQEDPWDS